MGFGNKQGFAVLLPKQAATKALTIAAPTIAVAAVVV